MQVINVRPRAGTIGVFLIVAIALGLIAYFILGVGRPGPTDREYVRAKLHQAVGVPMALPVELPAGYSVPDYYYFLPDDDRMVPVGPDQEVAAAWAVNLEPSHPDLFEHDPPQAQLCVQLLDDPRKPCNVPVGSDPESPEAASGTRVERQVGPVLVVVHAMVDVPEMDEWETVDFTTDLNKVTWLY
ncbi:hypothetical protein [Actinopolymorpha pittospori]|uniref:Uncharacterized protein n=1 Tax=Actinopolymorpha pittospori TaxID=648752 RepID=A0A927RIP3_9ACTN|nr:hypothetical protein [Actinopolymorpha pittospori]MBE1604773.1 hypothetical protein [Actinopolymorpha pittospori]